MESNSFYNNQNVYVEADYENIIVIDPNKMVEPDGKVVERLVNHEELVIYANLDAKIIPRTKLALGNNYDDTVQNLRIGAIDGDISSKVNFMKPKGKEYFDTSWTDQLTGDGSLSGEGINQTKVSWNERTIDVGNGESETQFIQKRTVQNQQDTQLLGIERISIKLNTSYVPTVTIEMVDIQGRMLFEQGENSPYSAFMQMPYPLFNLTIKGHFGKAIRYELMLKNFNARFDASDGNYRITTQYIARTYAILSDIQIESLFTLPRMYASNTTIGSNKFTEPTQQTTNGDNTANIRTLRSSLGREKISEVYSVYKNKGLIDEDFPDISLNEMLYKLNNFERYVMESYGSEDMTILTDIEKYKSKITEYRNRIWGAVEGSWYSKYIDPTRAVILNDLNNTTLHRFKNELERAQIEDALEELKKLVKQYNLELNSNTTFGSKGRAKIDGEEYDTSVECNIKYRPFIRVLDDTEQIDFKKSYRKTRLNSNPTELQLQTYKDGIISEFQTGEIELNNTTGEINDNVIFKTCIVFGERLPSASDIFNTTFLGKLSKLEEKFEEKKNLAEEELSKSLAKKVRREDIGLGFDPTIKNVMAVICASSDAFFRLMDKVHEDAWEQRKNPIRLSTIINPTNAFENKDSIETVTEDGQLNNESIVYPWPHYLELRKDKKGNEEYVNVYPGDSSVASKTQAFDSTTWPEVKFVEEYIRATLEKEGNGNTFTNKNDGKKTGYIFSSALEYPFNTNPYGDLTEVSFLYEIFERTLLASTINKYVRNGDYQNEIYQTIGDIEFMNVNESIKNSPSLMMKLKQYGFTYDNIKELMFNASKLGSWNTFIRDEYVTNYIKDYNDNPNRLYSTSTLLDGSNDIDNSTTSIQKLEGLLNSTKSNELSFLDGYPFTSTEWLKNNISNGNQVLTARETNKTTNTFNIIESKKVVASFNEEDEEYENKFFSNFNWVKNVDQPIDINNGDVTDNLNDNNGLNTSLSAINFFNNRKESQLYLTESYLDYSENYDSTVNNLTALQTSSLLNTPYFINAIISGVDKEKNNIQNPYTQLGYLYLNSLPLSNVSEKIKSYVSETTSNGDYIFSVLNKYSAIHKQSYLWFLKCGSIWHRYKKYHNDGVDILDEVWKDFDYKNMFDPIGGDYTKIYNLINSEGQAEPYQGFFNYEIIGEGEFEDNIYQSENVGIYPKLIDDIYYYFTNVSLFETYSDEEFNDAYQDKKLKICKNPDNFIFKGKGYDLDNPLRSFSQDSWSVYFEVKGNTDFFEYDENKILIVPSTGYKKFNHAEFECFNSLGHNTQDIIDNKSIHNGSVRSFWVSPNYGYFNNEYVTKPKHYEYLKNIDINSDNTQPFNINTGKYSNIEDLINLFDKDILDIFEKEFIRFCNKPLALEEISDNGIYNTSLITIMKKLFMVDKPNNDSNVNSFLEEIAKKQESSFNGYHRSEIFKEELILKMGNPSGFNRRVFKSFSNNLAIQPKDKINFGTYQINTVPGIGGATLTDSKNQNPEAWKEIYLNFGEPKTPGVEYTTNGSYITDFFYLFDIEFNEQNVRLLAPIIRIYTGKKLEDENYEVESFYSDLNNHIYDQEDFHRNILNHLFINLNRKLPDVTTNYEEINFSNVDGADLVKIDVWETFRMMNDKWVSGQDFKERTLFEDFLFLDRANRPVGDKVIVNIEKIRKKLKNRDDDLTVYQLVSDIMTDNGFTFMPTPVYTNFYGRHDRVKENEPIPQDIPNDMFGTFMEVDVRESRPRMLGIYIGEPSKNLKMNKNTNSRRLDDAFDMVRASDCPLIENSVDKKDYSDSNRCVGFNVDFGTRKQGIFKSISLDMSQHKNIAPTFQVLADMGSYASQQKVAQQSQSLYNFYKSQSYNCTIQSMGNAMIQPTMYFNLRHVPMFTGPYMIINVSHSISARDFTTDFEGIRIPKHALEVPDKLVMSVNRELLKSFQDKLKQEDVKNGKTANESDTADGEGKKKEISESNCQDITNYPDKEFVPMVNRYVTMNQIIQQIEEKQFTVNMGSYLYCLSHLYNEVKNNGEIDTKNYNVFNIQTSGDKNFNVSPGNVNIMNGQICISIENKGNASMASFESLSDVFEFMKVKYQNMSPILDDLVNNEYQGTISIDKKATALVKFLYNTMGIVEGNNAIDISNNIDNKMSLNTSFADKFNETKNVFKNALTTI